MLYARAIKFKFSERIGLSFCKNKATGSLGEFFMVQYETEPNRLPSCWTVSDKLLTMWWPTCHRTEPWKVAWRRMRSPMACRRSTPTPDRSSFSWARRKSPSPQILSSDQSWCQGIYPSCLGTVAIQSKCSVSDSCTKLIPRLVSGVHVLHEPLCELGCIGIGSYGYGYDCCWGCC